MLTKLNEIEIRVLGCLAEKELSTPDNYPLTLNSLVAACNQKTNRDPVIEYAEDAVTAALDSLRDKNLAYVFYGSSGRVPKYKHMLPSYYEIDPAEVAIVSVLMLRGAQTAGELNQRTGRLHRFEGLGEVNETLDRLIRREDPIVKRSPKQPGQKEVRYFHLLSENDETSSETCPEMPSSGSGSDRVDALEEEVTVLRGKLEALRKEFDEFKGQF